MHTTISDTDLRDASAILEAALYELKRVVVGQGHLLERLLVAVLCGGHVLVEGAPGLAKTLALKTLAQVLAVDFKRIQFTPDLLPADLVGTRLFNPAEGSFTTEPGPVFANFILADEINRAPAKVQSALLEVMQERQVTLGRETLPLPAPFLVMATQNPIESEGTYVLPEAQLDRFLFKIPVSYPSHDEEFLLLERITGAGLPDAKAILNAERLTHLMTLVTQVFLDADQMSRIVDIVQVTRTRMDGDLQYGASPRGALAIASSAKALALFRGRGYVTPQDVEAVLYDCLRHRLILSYEALAAGRSAEDVLARVLAQLPVAGVAG